MTARPFRLLAPLLALVATGPCVGQGYVAPAHTGAPAPAGEAAQADAGTQVERGRAPGYALAEHRRLAAALAHVAPGRPGKVEAYVVVAALDSDPVFGREAREAARVLARRYDAAGRTVLLAGTDGSGPSTLPIGSPAAVEAALARVAEAMNRDEDVLVLYTTSHGAPYGIVYQDADSGFGAIGPRRLAATLQALGIGRRVLMISACYSGVFVGQLAGPDTAIVTAAAADRSSFGCVADNDWTFFGDALVNHALRRPVAFAPAVEAARAEIAGWETAARLERSFPDVMIGERVAGWLGPLEARLPAATAPVGRPASAALGEIRRR